MSISILRLYGELSILLCLATFALWAAWALLQRRDGTAARWVTLGYLLIGTALAAPLAARLGMSAYGDAAARPVQIWSGSLGDSTRVGFAVRASGRAQGEDGQGRWGGSVAQSTARALCLGLLAASGLGLTRLLWRWRRLRRHCRQLTPMRACGRLHVCVSDSDPTPYSTWSGRRSFVVVPISLLADPPRLRLAIRHELVHIRRRDTVAAFLLAVVRALFPWHPALGAWTRLMARLQEHACDQALIARGVPLQAYADCLVRAARMADTHRCRPTVAVGLGPRNRHALTRRIEMLARRSDRRNPWVVPAVAVAGLALLGLVASAATAIVADRRATRTEAEAIAAAVVQRDGFVVPVDDMVVEQLGLMIGAPEQRDHWRAALQRGATLRLQIDPILQAHGVPAELAAVAMIESAFRNLPAEEGSSSHRGAGVWQFIPETARHFGLQVDATHDERLDLDKATDAAARYLRALHDQLGDWPLAIAAYTHGESAVSQAVERGGTRDAAKLVASGALSSYSSQVLAAILLNERPDLLRP
jgi:membrane-bound lytic murein transglycosylase D